MEFTKKDALNFLSAMEGYHSLLKTIHWSTTNKSEHELVDDIDEKMLFKDYRYDVLVSGHLHKGLIYSSETDGRDKLYLGIPSTTNINLNNAVGYLVYMDESGENIVLAAPAGTEG